MFDAKKLRGISNDAQAELERKKREAEEFVRLEKERLKVEEARKEHQRQEDFRIKAEEEATRRRLVKSSASFLQVVKRETVLSASKGSSEGKINIEAEIDKDWVTSELKSRRFKVSWNTKANARELARVVQLIDDFRRTRYIQNLPSGIPELDDVINGIDEVFDFLMDEILSSDGAIFSKGKLPLAHIKWQNLTEQWCVVFELANIHPIDEWASSATEGESQNVKLLNILRSIYVDVNALFESGSHASAVLHVWWDLDWLQADSSGEWDSYRLGWLSSYVGQHFLGQLELHLRECATTAKNSTCMLMEPLAPNPERWGSNSVFRAKVNGKPIGAVILSLDLVAFMLRTMGFKIEISLEDNGHLFNIAW